MKKSKKDRQMEHLKVFEKTVKSLMENMTKKSLAQLVAAFLILEEDRNEGEEAENNIDK